MLDTVKNAPVNGLDLAALGEVVEGIEKDSSKAIVGFDVVTRWKGQTRSETTVTGFTLAGERITRNHTIVADEPFELLGSDGAPNPQELLMAALNACLTERYVVAAAQRGITLQRVRVDSSGTLDLRGLFGLDAVDHMVLPLFPWRRRAHIYDRRRTGGRLPLSLHHFAAAGLRAAHGRHRALCGAGNRHVRDAQSRLVRARRGLTCQRLQD